MPMVTRINALYVFPYVFLDAAQHVATRTRKNRGAHFPHMDDLLTPMPNILKRFPNPTGEGCRRSERNRCGGLCIDGCGRLYWARSNQGFYRAPKPANCSHGGLMGSGSLREKCSSNDSDLPRKPGPRLLDKEWVRDLVAGDLSGSTDLALPLGDGVLALSAVEEKVSASDCGDGSCRGRSPPGN